jgi:hypothetical protein
MIRKAELRDVESIVELGVEFGLKTQGVHTLEVSATKIRDTVEKALAYENAVLLVYEIEGKVEGVVFGLGLDTYFSGDVVLQELALYSRKSSGLIRLLDAFEKEAEVRGIKKIAVGCKPSFQDMAKIYLRKGFKLLETQFLKEI